MKKRHGFLLFLVLLAQAVFAQSPIYEERFNSGAAQLNWITGDGFSQLATGTVTGNPSGDGTVGYVKGVAEVGGTGQILSGDQTLKDYRIEAQVYVSRSASAGSGTNNGILARIVPLDQTFMGYVFATDFDSNNRLRLRKFTGAGGGAPPAVVRDWSGAEIPGGLPTTSGWHKLVLEFQGDQINAYYDDQLLPGSPFTDTQSDSGFFGVYCFVGFDTATDSATFFDDVVVTSLTTGIEEEQVVAPASFQLKQNYPNPFNPATNLVFNLAQPAEVELDIFNVNGQNVASLTRGLWQAGEHRVAWQANGMPSGVYIARLRASGQIVTRKMLLAK